MPGQPTFATAASYGDYAAPGVSMKGDPTHTSFLVWVVLLGVVLPVLVIGGLQFGGWKFVFKGR